MPLEHDYLVPRAARLLSFESPGAGTPLVVVHGSFGFAYVIDTIIIAGGEGVGAAWRWNIFISDDNDATGTRTPTGDPVYTFRGRLLAGDFAVPHWMPTQPGTFHPRQRVTRTPTYLKALFDTGAVARYGILVTIIPLGDTL